MKEFTKYINASIALRFDAYMLSNFVSGDGAGNCKLFTQKDRDSMRVFLDQHQN